MESGNVAWILVSAALVLFMTPGLAFFYGGMDRSRNVLNMLMMNFYCVLVIPVLWVVVGYSLSQVPFGNDFIGGLDAFMLRGVGIADNGAALSQIAYLGMFAAITPALVDVMSGAVPVFFNMLGNAVPYEKSGKLRLLGMTGLQRSPLLPDAPTVAEALPGFESVVWHGMVVPAKTPGSTIARINAEIARALKAPEVAKALSDVGADDGLIKIWDLTAGEPRRQAPRARHLH